MDGMRDTLGGFALYEPNVFLSEGARSKRVIVKVKTTRQPPTAVKDKCAYHCASSVATLLEGLRHGSELWSQWLASKVLHSILKRIRTRQDHGMRGPGQWHLRNSAVEHNTVVGKRIESGDLDTLISVTRQMIGTDRVDSNENDVNWNSTRGERARERAAVERKEDK